MPKFISSENIGSSNKDLVLQTSGKIKIKWGKKYIDLLDNNGNLKVPQPKSAITILEEDEQPSGTGFFYRPGSDGGTLYCYINGNSIEFQVSQGGSSEYYTKQESDNKFVNVDNDTDIIKNSEINNLINNG